jgi:hypothetical protein
VGDAAFREAERWLANRIDHMEGKAMDDGTANTAGLAPRDFPGRQTVMPMRGMGRQKDMVEATSHPELAMLVPHEAPTTTSGRRSAGRSSTGAQAMGPLPITGPRGATAARPEQATAIR